MSTSTVSRLDSLRATGLVRRASERVDAGVGGSLPVAAVLRPLLPGGCLRRGSTIAIGAAVGGSGAAGARAAGFGAAGSGPAGATSLLFALLAEASAAGSWCAAVGLPRLGLVAAAEAGMAVQRLALVPNPGPDWVDTVGALLDGLDLVAMATPGAVAPRLSSRIAARARQRGAVLVAVGAWPGADVTLDVVRGSWHGLGEGVGRLRCREVEVVASGRGAAARPRRVHLWLPGTSGAAATPRIPPPGLVDPPGRSQTPVAPALTPIERSHLDLERRRAS